MRLLLAISRYVPFSVNDIPGRIGPVRLPVKNSW